MVRVLYAVHPEALPGVRQPPSLPAGKQFRFCKPTALKARPSVQRITVAFAKSAKRVKYSQASSRPARGRSLFIQVEPDGSDAWRLDVVVDALKAGSVGIVPTDTYPALVCDISDKNAVEKLYAIKGLSPKKQLSILCRNLQDISTYTLGFPASNIAGQIDVFRVARQVLPGPYTFILTASKQLPKQCTDYQSGKSKQRKSVGVRIPDDIVLQAVLSQLDRPLLCTSAHVEEQDQLEIPEAAMFMDLYAGQGLDFVVDSGQRVAEGSTVIDMTGPEPILMRQGKGDPSLFVEEVLA
ncbi:hypothetical protein ABBQ38_003835 [Trebouxia sp. C0009 RCD-2024]